MRNLKPCVGALIALAGWRATKTFIVFRRSGSTSVAKDSAGGRSTLDRAHLGAWQVLQGDDDHPRLGDHVEQLDGVAVAIEPSERVTNWGLRSCRTLSSSRSRVSSEKSSASPTADQAPR